MAGADITMGCARICKEALGFQQHLGSIHGMFGS